MTLKQIEVIDNILTTFRNENRFNRIEFGSLFYSIIGFMLCHMSCRFRNNEHSFVEYEDSLLSLYPTGSS